MRQFAQKEIGERIAQARKESGGMTQDELAELLNVSKRSVQDYEAGTTVPWKHFQMLEEVFKRPLGWFLHGEPDSELPEGLAQQLADAMDGLAEVVARFESIAGRLEALPGAKAPTRSGRKTRTSG
jgi:transcriptional regulator with XRE-family HTH domain